VRQRTKNQKSLRKVGKKRQKSLFAGSKAQKSDAKEKQARWVCVYCSKGNFSGRRNKGENTEFNTGKKKGRGHCAILFKGE